MKKVIDSQGYIRVKVGRDHPAADTKGWAYAHRLAWYDRHGVLPPGHDLHHRDGDKQNNAYANLSLLSHDRHARLEARRMIRSTLGTFIGRAS